jgi:ubiquinone/menaquinone biosynthesis C-methylase UbiE
MKSIKNMGLENVQAVYSGPEGDLWELVMGQQIHIGGFQSSMDLAQRAGIGAGMHGVDLCCCNGAGMRFLVQFCHVASMRGVDATEKVVERGRARGRAAGLDQHITFTIANVCATGLPSASADFVWGEDAWCYVVDKPALIAEAARLVKPGGVIAFTDWVEGPAGLSEQEADRFLTFMKFANLEDLVGYKDLLTAHGCDVLVAEDTHRFPEYIGLYLQMLNKQLTFDALQIIGFDLALMQTLAEEMAFIQQLAHAGKVVQGLFIARKRQ